MGKKEKPQVPRNLHYDNYALKPDGSNCRHCKTRVAVAYRSYEYVGSPRQRNVEQFCQHCFERTVVSTCREFVTRTGRPVALVGHTRFAAPWITLDDPGFAGQELAFRGAVLMYHEDPGPKLVYADWLEEQGGLDNSWTARLYRLIANRVPPVTADAAEARSPDTIDARTFGRPPWIVGWSPAWGCLYVGLRTVSQYAGLHTASPEPVTYYNLFTHAAMLVRGRLRWFTAVHTQPPAPELDVCGLQVPGYWVPASDSMAGIDRTHRNGLATLAGLCDQAIASRLKELACPAAKKRRPPSKKSSGPPASPPPGGSAAATPSPPPSTTN